MDYKIRQANKEDLRHLARFEIEISLISFGDEAITDSEFHLKKLRKAMDKEPDGMFVLDINDTPAGWLWMDIKTNFLTEERYVNFRSFYLVENRRGGPEGEALLAHGMEYCKTRGARSVVGKVHSGNLPMRALYKKMGFAATHITMEYHFTDAGKPPSGGASQETPL